MEKISGVYKITNIITGDFYIGSSNDIKRRWNQHKRPSVWKKYSNSLLYKDMQKYGVDKFVLEILAEVEVGSLKEIEQQLIKKLKPTYNNYNAKGFDFERRKEYQKEYEKTDKRKEYKKSNKYKKAHRKASKEYEKTDKYKEYKKEYDNQLCSYNGETITLNALRRRFWRRGISNPTQEAKKYLLNKSKR